MDMSAYFSQVVEGPRSYCDPGNEDGIEPGLYALLSRSVTIFKMAEEQRHCPYLNKGMSGTKRI